jgi:hypothetical protein
MNVPDLRLSELPPHQNGDLQGVLHKLLHNCFPEPPKTHRNGFRVPTFHSNIRKVASFRNRQVIGSSPIVGSISKAHPRLSSRTFAARQLARLLPVAGLKKFQALDLC